MKRLKKVDTKILVGLMKNSKISDRKLADSIGVSQPTITRRRARLEGALLSEYTIIPNFAKLGMEIMAFHFANWKPEAFKTPSQKKDFVERIDKYVSDNPNLIFISSGQGLGMSRIAISIHRSYSDYVNFETEFQKKFGRYAEKRESFLVSLKSDKVKRPLTFKYLADYIERANGFDVAVVDSTRGVDRE